MIYRIPSEIVWQDVRGELALFDARSETYSALNGSAAAIWREIASGADVDTIVDRLATAYDVPPAAMADDVAAFVTDALAKGLLAPAAA